MFPAKKPALAGPVQPTSLLSTDWLSLRGEDGDSVYQALLANTPHPQLQRLGKHLPWLPTRSQLLRTQPQAEENPLSLGWS